MIARITIFDDNQKVIAEYLTPMYVPLTIDSPTPIFTEDTNYKGRYSCFGFDFEPYINWLESYEEFKARQFKTAEKAAGMEEVR